MSSPLLKLAKQPDRLIGTARQLGLDRHMGLSLLGMLWLAFITMRYGPGMDVDAVYYMLLARKLAISGDILRFDSDNPGHWPPLYSILMAIPFLLKVSYFWGAYVINILLYGISTYLASRQIKALLTQRSMRIVAQLLLLFGFPILYIYVKAQSEILFMTLIIALYHFYAQYISKPSLGRILVLGLIAGLLCLTRYAGLPYVGAVTIMMLLNRQIPAKEKLQSIVIFLAIALLPLLLWTLRPLLAPNPHVFQYPDTYTLGIWEGISKAFDAMSSWTPGGIVPKFVCYPVFSLVLINAIYLCFNKGPHQHILRFYTISILIYITFIVYSAIMGFCSEPDSRFLAPAFFPLYMLALFSAGNVFIEENLNRLFRTIVIIITPITAAFMLLYGIFYGFELLMNGAGGYRTVRWVESPTQKWISFQKKMHVVYTNRVPPVLIAAGETPDNIYDITNRYSAHKAPVHYNKSEKAYLIRYHDEVRGINHPDSNFLTTHHFNLLRSFDGDGEVYYSNGR